MKYDVEVVTAYVFEVEANSQEEANKKAIEAAELKPGQWYDWQVLEEPYEPPFCDNCKDW